jgi:hypothetical protein
MYVHLTIPQAAGMQQRYALVTAGTSWLVEEYNYTHCDDINRLN